MPRIPAIAYEAADATAQEIFDHYQKERGNVPNMFRTVAYRFNNSLRMEPTK